MKNSAFIVPILFLSISPLAAQSQQKQDNAYAFKGDRLGMSIQDFNAAHYHLVKQFGSTYLEPLPSCSKQIIEGYTLCQYDSSIGGMTTPVKVLFTDGVLTAIDLTFPRPTTEADLTLMKDGLTTKYGTPTKSFMSQAAPGQVSAGTILFWENANSIMEFQQTHCGFDSSLEINIWSIDMAEASRGVSCSDTKNDRLSPQLSRVFYVYKPLANLLSARIAEAIQKVANKAKSDF